MSATSSLPPVGPPSLMDTAPAGVCAIVVTYQPDLPVLTRLVGDHPEFIRELLEDFRSSAFAAREHIVGLVVGLPLNMDGSDSPRTQSVRAFARNFSKLTDLPIALWDERLSTAAVERELIAADVSRAKRAAVIDQHAAAFILQGAIDRLRNIAGT